MDNCIAIYKLTGKFPSHELYNLVSQIRRAAVSIPSNIAEGYARRGDKELKQFLTIAISSSSELETQFEIAKRLGYLRVEEVDKIMESIDQTARMITSFYKSIK